MYLFIAELPTPGSQGQEATLSRPRTPLAQNMYLLTWGVRDIGGYVQGNFNFLDSKRVAKHRGSNGPKRSDASKALRPLQQPRT